MLAPTDGNRRLLTMLDEASRAAGLPTVGAVDPARAGAADISFDPAEVVEHFRLYFGPTQKAFESLDADGQAALRTDLEDLWEANNQATDGTTKVESEYLEVRATKA